MYQIMPTLLSNMPMFLILTIMLNKNHLLTILLLLEIFMLMTIMNMLAIMNLSSDNLMMISMFILSITACEASLGLATLVVTCRFFGNDKISTPNNIW